MSILSSHSQSQQPRQSDRRLEAAINSAFTELLSAPNRMQQVAAWSAMVSLIKSRSPAQVEKMESLRGLQSRGWEHL